MSILATSTIFYVQLIVLVSSYNQERNICESTKKRLILTVLALCDLRKSLLDYDLKSELRP
jgi:hypothetical protein